MATPSTVGAEENNPDHDPIGEFNGRTDDVRLYPRGLSASEIASYVRSIGNPPPTPHQHPSPSHPCQPNPMGQSWLQRQLAHQPEL